MLRDYGEIVELNTLSGIFVADIFLIRMHNGFDIKTRRLDFIFLCFTPGGPAFWLAFEEVLAVSIGFSI